MPEDQLQTLDVLELTTVFVCRAAEMPGDINVKIASLRAAADVLSQVVTAATMAALVRRSLSP